MHVPSKTYSSDYNSTSNYIRIPPRTGLEPWLTVKKSIISPILSPTLLQIYCIELIGPISISYWVWAAICELTYINIDYIINSLKAGGNTIASVEPLIQDAILFSNSYSELQYSHCRRKGNTLAHSLARYSINVSNYVVWMEKVPNHLLSDVQQDLANFANQFQ